MTRIRPAARAFSPARRGAPRYRFPLLASAALTGTALLAAAFWPAGPSAGGGASTPATSAAATPSQPPAAATSAPAAPAASSAAVPAPASGPAAGPSACAALAARTYLHLTAVLAGPAAALTVTGNPARLSCGGPDDFHYDFGTASVTGQVTAGAFVVTFSLATMSPRAISTSQLAAYLAGDRGTRIFLVTGPLARITGLREEFHP